MEENKIHSKTLDWEKHLGGTGDLVFPQELETSGQGTVKHLRMTLRDYFAAKALQGLCAGRSEYEQPGASAKFCYELADAMLKEREKPHNPKPL